MRSSKTDLEPLKPLSEDMFPNEPFVIAYARPRPFLKWAGGKRSILPILLDRFPATATAYFEMFLGGGALFFAARPENAQLSDINGNLIATYVAVRDKVSEVISQLEVHRSSHNKKHFLEARHQIATESDPAALAALFIYLNKTCYNGLYRVNKSGEFNVPMGSYLDPTILDDENLFACSAALQNVEIVQRDFSQTPIVKGAFYYIDPPYHRTFSSYDESGFGDAKHEQLAKFCTELDGAGAYFMLSNSDTPFIRQLYARFREPESVSAARSLSCKVKQRGRENELLIRNY